MLRIGKRSVLVVVTAVVASACRGAAAPSPTPTLPATPMADPGAAAVGWTNRTLAVGSIAALPTAPMYINFVEVAQPPANPLQPADVAGIVYSVMGTHQLVIQGGTTTSLEPGQATFVPQDIVHSHVNPGTSPNQWYFIALRNVRDRTAAMPFPGGSVLYETTDLPTPPAGKHGERLDLVTLEKGGRGYAHRHAGVEALVVLDGTVELRVAGQRPTTVTKGKGAYVPADTVMQTANPGEGIARFLNFIVWPDGAEVTTLVGTAP